MSALWLREPRHLRQSEVRVTQDQPRAGTEPEQGQNQDRQTRELGPGPEPEVQGQEVGQDLSRDDRDPDPSQGSHPDQFPRDVIQGLDHPEGLRQGHLAQIWMG